MSDNAAKIAQLRAEADALEAADKAFRGLPEEHQLAIILHEMMCHHNHIDGCGWEYENLPKAGGGYQADWNGHAHGRYLLKSRLVLGFCAEHKIQPNTAIDLIQAVNRS